MVRTPLKQREKVHENMIRYAFLLVVYGVLPLVPSLTAQPRPPVPTLTWTYTQAAPEWFVVRRILDGGQAPVARVPGRIPPCRPVPRPSSPTMASTPCKEKSGLR